MSATVAAILALVTAAIQETPELVTEIESLIASIKRNASGGGDPNPAPIAPKIETDTAGLSAKLGI